MTTTCRFALVLALLLAGCSAKQDLLRAGQLIQKAEDLSDQGKYKDADGTETAIEAQCGYIIKGHDLKLYLGYQRLDLDGTIGNQVFLGIQMKK